MGRGLRLVLASAAVCAALGCDGGAMTPGSIDVAAGAGEPRCAETPSDGLGRGLPAQAAILEVANTVSADELRIRIGEPAAVALQQARSEAAFDSLAQLYCLSEITESELRALYDLSGDLCGGSDGVAQSIASPRMCAAWARACSSFDDGQAQCQSQSPQGTFAIAGRAAGEAALLLPIEVRFADAAFVAQYADGRSASGLAQQWETPVADGSVWMYLSLPADAHAESPSEFAVELAPDGNRMVLEPLVGPVGRDVESPVHVRTDT